MPMLLCSLLTISNVCGPWIYESAGAAPLGSRCRQAAWLGEEIVAACQDGLWRGKPESLNLLLPCVHDDGLGPQVKVWGEGLIASCACGLYAIDSQGLRRMNAPGRAGALAADGRRGLIAEVEGQLWHWAEPASAGRLLATLPEGSVIDLRWRGDDIWILRWRGNLRLVEGGFERLAGPPGAWMWSGRAGRRHWIDRLGRAWSAGPGELPRPVEGLILQAGETIERVEFPGAGIWIASDLRWWWRGAGAAPVGGRLPSWAEKLVAVRGRSVQAGPPWLMGRRHLYRPRRIRRRPGRPCLGSEPVRLDWSDLVLPRARPWPRLSLSASVGRRLFTKPSGPEAWFWSGRQTWALGLGLSWPLSNSTAYKAQAERSRAQADWRAEGRERQRLAISLERVRADLCRQGAPAVDLEEVQALLTWLIADSSFSAERSSQ